MTTLEAIPAISIKQPWAELILRNKKKIEIRSWDSKYRGKLYLHTGRVPDSQALIKYENPQLFLGGFIGVIELVAIIPFTQERWEQWREQHLSDGPFRPGFAWMIRNPRRFVEPVSAPGEPFLFYPSPNTSKILEETPYSDRKS